MINRFKIHHESQPTIIVYETLNSEKAMTVEVPEIVIFEPKRQSASTPKPPQNGHCEPALETFAAMQRKKNVCS
jgi:hypothetical protein